MLKHLTEQQIETVIEAAEALNAIRETGAAALPYREALYVAISGLSRDVRLELMALMWLGRADDADATFDQLLSHARTIHHSDDAAVGYIAQKTRALPEYLREGLSRLKESA